MVCAYWGLVLMSLHLGLLWQAGNQQLYAAAVALCFFDYEEPLLFFLLDYVAVMGLFVWLGYYFTRLLRKLLPG